MQLIVLMGWEEEVVIGGEDQGKLIPSVLQNSDGEASLCTTHWIGKHSSLGSVHSSGLGLEFEYSYYRQDKNHQHRLHETFIKRRRVIYF